MIARLGSMACLLAMTMPATAAAADGSASAGRGWGTAALVAIGLAALALGGATGWNASLTRQVRRRTRELRELAERHALQANVLAHVTDAIVMADRDGLVTSWNAGAEQLFGIPAATALGQAAGALITNRLAAPRDGDLHGALAAGADWRGDAEIVRPSGDTRFIEAALRGVADEEGRRIGTLIVAHDVDARRRAEVEAGIRARQQAAIASLGQRALAGIDFRLLVDQAVRVAASTLEVSNVALFRLSDDGAGLVLQAGDGWDAFRAGEFRIAADRTFPACALSADGGTATLDHRDPACPVVEAAHLREGITAGVSVVVPGRSAPYGILTAADRRPHRFSRDDVHFLQALANVIGASWERSIVDAELRSELALHDATLEAVADGILVSDAAGRVRRYNQRLIEMWGHPPEVLERPYVEDWVRWSMSLCENAEERFADFQAAAHTDAPQSVTIVLKDGRVFERHSQPQRVDGRIEGRVWCYRDVTERLRAEEERRRLEAQMQHVQKLESLGVLAGGIAHDFNNLLVGILGHAGLALQELAAEHPAHEFIGQIQTGAQRAAELTNQMLAYSGRGRFVLQASDLSGIVGEIANLLRASVARNAELTLDLAPGLPAFDGDPAQIRQVIMNLITNASDAIGNEPGQIRVTTGVMRATREYLAGAWVGSDAPEGDYVFAEVSDTGCGMDAATLARIFDPFFTTKFTGRGLGLAAVLGIVRGHHGAITIASRLGHGSTFRVLLPATSVKAAPPPAVERPVPRHASGARVLVVDDEAGVRTIARESLKRAGFEVTTASDGAEALEMLDGGAAFDVVLLDMTMPRLNGVETFRGLRERVPSLPVVLTSGYSAQEAASRFDGIAGFIQKPFMPAALARTMLEALESRDRRMA